MRNWRRITPFLAGLTQQAARRVLPLGRAAAQRALDIDPSLPEAHAELASAAVFLDYDWMLAEHHFRLAMARDPVPSTVRHWYGFFYLMPLGRIAEAIDELERSLRDDPLNVMCRTQIAVLNWTAGRYDESDHQFRRAQELDEHFWLPWLLSAACLAETNAVVQALTAAERAHALAPSDPGWVGVLAGLLSRLGDSERAGQLVLGLRDPGAYGVPLGWQMYHHVRLEFDKAAEWAEKAIEQRHPSAIPETCTSARKYFVAAGLWPRLARLLRLPEAVTAPTASGTIDKP